MSALSVTVRDGIATLSITEVRKELTTVVDDVLAHDDVMKVRIIRNGKAVAELTTPIFEDDEDADRLTFGDDDGDDGGDES